MAAWVRSSVLILLMAAAASLDLHSIGQKSIWLDEGIGIEIARLNWYNFLRILWRREANMALYYLLQRAWLPFGTSEAWIRSLSVLPAVAMIPGVYILGRRLFDARVGLIAAFLLSVNTYLVRYAQEARSYSLYAFLCLVSSIYFVEFLHQPSRRNRILHVLFSALAVYTHFYAGLLVVTQWLSLRIGRGPVAEIKTEKNWQQFAIAISPLIVWVALTGLGPLRWIPRPGLTDLRNTALFLAGNGGWWLTVVYAAAIIPALITAMQQGKSAADWEVWRFRFLLLWLLFPVVFVFLISQLKPFYLIRYFIFVLPALSLLGAAGLGRLRSRWLLAIALIVFGFLSLRGVANFYKQDFDISREDWRDASRYLLTHAQPGDAVLFHHPMGRMPYEYYRSITPAGNAPTVVFPKSGDTLSFRDFYTGHAKDEFLETLPPRYSRLWVVLVYTQTPTGPDPTTHFLTDLFARKYGSEERQEFAGIEVRLYQGGGTKEASGSIESR